jgi:VWFA-related protein
MKRELMRNSMIVAIACLAIVAVRPLHDGGAVVSAESMPQDLRARQQEVRVIYQLTDVVVRDADGNFVRGLKPEDFSLEVDGNGVEIKSVDEFEAPDPNDESIIRYVKWVEEAQKQGAELPQAPTPPRYIIMVFDRFCMGQAALKASIESAKKIVDEGLLPHDRVAVFVYNGVLRTLTGPTTDKNRIIGAIEAANVNNFNDHYRPSVAEIFPPRDRTELWDLKSTLQKKSIDFQNYIESMRVLASSLEALPGRKTYLLFSEGFNLYNPMAPENTASISALARLTSTPEFANETSGYLSPHLVATQLTELAKYMGSTNASIYTIRRGPMKPEWTLGLDVDVSGKQTYDFDMHTVISQVEQQMETDRVDNLRDTARLTHGKFFDTGMNDDNLIQNLREEVGNYYVLGFVPPKSNSGQYHTIKVEAVNQSYRVVHRDGFFESKEISRMSDKERAVHLEEGFLVPGVRNELGIAARTFTIPIPGNPQTIMAFSIDTAKIEKGSKGGYEIEMVINVEDREGRIRYRNHKIFKSGDGQLPSELWFSENIPVLPNGAGIYLALRDNSNGRRSTFRDIYRAHDGPQDAVQLVEPMMLSPDISGGLAKWKGEDVKDGIKTADPLSALDIKLPGRPLINNTVSQGEDALVVVTVGNLPRDLNPSQLNISVQFALDPTEEKSFLLTASDLKTQYLGSQRLLILTARVPVGLAQRESGIISAAISGLFGQKVMLTTLTYRIQGFSVQKAQELLQDPRISELN